MKLRVFSDNTVNIDVATIVENLKRVAPSITWVNGKTEFKVKEEFIEYPGTHERLAAKLKQEIKNDDLAILFTEKPYDNNHFWESGQYKAVVVSLYGWDLLTTLPRNNGAVYFLVALLVRKLGIGISHTSKNTGCINDYWRDKTGIDAGMRSAFICVKCSPKTLPKQTPINLVSDIQNILDHLSLASRAEENVIDFWARQQVRESFDVFLCHNSQDKPTVRELNNKLKKFEIRTWLDEEQLPPGRPWQELLEKQIEEIGAVAIIVGESGIGPWHDMELRAFISEFGSRKLPIIPVILGDCSTVPKLPLFLSQFTWVDFRKSTPPPLEQLLWGITGKKPESKKEPNPSLKRRVRLPSK